MARGAKVHLTFPELSEWTLIKCLGFFSFKPPKAEKGSRK